MKIRKSSEIESVLEKKGFELTKSKKHHRGYILVVNGKKTKINTYFSHGKKDYGNNLLSAIKKQLKFNSKDKFEAYLDCTMNKEGYINMLREQKEDY